MTVGPTLPHDRYSAMTMPSSDSRRMVAMLAKEQASAFRRPNFSKCRIDSGCGFST